LKRWRESLTYLAMSLLVAWHSLAIIVAPMPDGSAMVQWLRAIVNPYISLFRLDNHWNFFAPTIARQTQLSYAIEDAAGARHEFKPSQDPTGSLPRYFMWREFKYLYEGIMEDPEAYGDRITSLLCRKHASLNPTSVSMSQIQELDFRPEDYLQGHHPLDPDFVNVVTFADAAC